MFLPSHPPEPYAHFVVGSRYFLVRRSGALERIPKALLKPGRQDEIRAELATWQRGPDGGYIFDEVERAAGRVGDPLDMVADFSRIPDWVTSDPSTHFMVQDRDRDVVRIFWGVSGYAELEVLGDAPAAAEGDQAGRVRFEQLPAPPEMEELRALLLSPPEFERPASHYRHDHEGRFGNPLVPRRRAP